MPIECDEIEAVLPQTIAYLGEPFQPLTKPFLSAYPPHSITRYDNARQLFEFLVRRWNGRPKSRPYLLDLARYELAVAEARIQPWVKSTSELAETANPTMVRRSSSISLIRCNHDIRPLLERDDFEGMPEKRSLFLAIVLPRESSSERVFEIGADLAGFLARLTEWRPVSSIQNKLDQLFELELVEGRCCASV